MKEVLGPGRPGGWPLTTGEDGLVPAVVQDAASGQVLMLAYMNEESLQKTLQTGETWFWSRSRGELWHKGATSGNRQRVVEVRADCDRDALLVLVEQVGNACHEGDFACFHYHVDEERAKEAQAPAVGPLLGEVMGVVRDRQANPQPGSYTNSLFEKGPDAIGRKVVEEATEVLLALKNGDRENLAFEVADLWFHCMVALAHAGIDLDDVAERLAARRGKRR